MDNIDEFLKQGRERRQQYIDELREANPTEPLIIEGRPFTPDDLQHLDELNEEMMKQNPPKPYQWKKGMLSHYQWEEMYFHRPIVITEPPMKKTKEPPITDTEIKRRARMVAECYDPSYTSAGGIDSYDIETVIDAFTSGAKWILNQLTH